MIRNKLKNWLGYILGGVCFVPAFFCCFLVCKISPIIGFPVLIITQGLWLASIRWCTQKLENENQQLKELLRRLYESAYALDIDTCTIINRCSIIPDNKDEKLKDICMSGEEYDKHMDVFIKVEEYLKKEGECL